MSFYEKWYGTTLKGGVAARIEHVSRFLNWSWWFYITPRCRSSVFYRVGFHVKCWLFLGMGLFCFFVEVVVIYRHSTYFRETLVDYSSRVHKDHVNLSMRIISFVLSAYVVMLVKVYHTGTRRKARDMMYGCSNAVDTLSVCLNYDHPSAKKLLPGLHSAMTVIGQYALAQASKKTREFKLSQDEMIDLFHRKDLDGAYLTKITPKQCLHVLRLAILQSVASERKENGCLSLMTHSDWKTFRRDLNDYCGGASQTISALSSSKLPYAYFQLINWATHSSMLYMSTMFFLMQAEEWHRSNTCTPWHWEKDCKDDEAIVYGIIFWVSFVLNCFFQLIMLYFVFGCLELYEVTTTRMWESGLVHENYVRILELICEPLMDSKSRPKNIQQLRREGVDDGWVENSGIYKYNTDVPASERPVFFRRGTNHDDPSPHDGGRAGPRSRRWTVPAPQPHP